MREEVPSRRLGPILKALEMASAEEREQILAGIGALRRLLESVVSEGSENPLTGETPTGQGAP